MIHIINRGVKSHYDSSKAVAASNANKMEIFYDGVSSTDPSSPNLPGNVAWMDGTSLYHTGINLGATFQYLGTANVIVEGALVDRFYAEQVKSAANANLITTMNGNWIPISVGALGPATALVGQFGVFDLMRFTFSGGPGTLIIVTL